MADSGAAPPVDDDLNGENVVTVSQLNAELATHVENADGLHYDYIVGDVTDCGVANGHVHFDLVDGDASIHCVLFGFRRGDVGTAPEVDLRVAVQGELSFYEAQGSCSILVTDVVTVGEGEYQQLYEQARAALAEDGLLADERKQALPEHPATVGLVTSADSDAATDTITAIHARYPEVDILLKHASVQGEAALEELMEAISVLDRDDDVDVLVVTRGGGADHTLRVFNEPPLCRVIANTDTPICVGVGHEDDRTLADEVADHRVMTPTHAGEVVPERVQYEERFDTLEHSLETAYESAVETRITDVQRNLTDAYERRVTADLQQLEQSLHHASETRIATRLTELDNQLTAAYDAVERTKAHEEEKEKAVAEARQDASQLRVRRRRRYQAVIGLLGLLVVALVAYIILYT
jgi:exodeoxyribonuclease VII large subunit